MTVHITRTKMYKRNMCGINLAIYNCKSNTVKSRKLLQLNKTAMSSTTN